MSAVRVWTARTDTDPSPWEPLLSADERERASGFRFERHRRRWTVARGVLRRVLACHVGVEPSELVLTPGSHGKLSLEGGPELNLSHSGDLVVVAVADRAVGVDVEQVCADRATADIARRFFSPAEVTELESLPDTERVRAFFRVWTRKEAFVKARGEGLSLPLHSFDVTVTSAAALVATRPDPRETSRWWMSDLGVEDGYEAALCCASPRAGVECLPAPDPV